MLTSFLFPSNASLENTEAVVVAPKAVLFSLKVLLRLLILERYLVEDLFRGPPLKPAARIISSLLEGLNV
jgi:hypothetical protein